jgi:hypothetical protein
VYITQKSDAEVSNSDPGFDNMAIALSYGFAVLIPTINPSEYSFQHQPYASLPRDRQQSIQASPMGGELISSGTATGPTPSIRLSSNLTSSLRLRRSMVLQTF